jgi:DNA-binding transcriptional MerR regulator
MLSMSLPSDIPVKIYYSIREVSDYTGVEPHVLRYWETKFSKLRPKRVGGNQRKYTRADLELIMEIIRLRHREGYTLDGAEKRLRSTPKGAVAEEAAADLGLQEIRKGLEQILALVS